MILDEIKNWRNYAGLGNGIARGLELLASGKLDGLAEGKHPIDGEALYASVQEYALKAPADCRWEAHRRYVDIQYIVFGREAMGSCPIDQLVISRPYDEIQDVAFFHGTEADGTLLKVEAKMFAVFFPQDAHRPMMALATPENQPQEPVKKIVLKVALV